MQDNLNIITEFANTVSAVVKQFADLCREHARKIQESKPQFEEVQNELIRQRKKRMELEDIIRQKVSGSQLSDQTLSDIVNNHEERKRPRTAFTLFVNDLRNKILREHPTLDLTKITTLAVIKWKKLSRQQQMVYERKLEEINKLAYELSRNIDGDQSVVKRQFRQENNAADNGEHQQGQQIPGQNTNIQQGSFFPSTLENQEHQAIQEKDQVKPRRQKCVIENMLDLFHTQYQTPQKIENVREEENSQIKPSANDEPSPSNPINNVECTPSLQIIEPATQNHPIIIPPTIQE